MMKSFEYKYTDDKWIKDHVEVTVTVTYITLMKHANLIRYMYTTQEKQHDTLSCYNVNIEFPDVSFIERPLPFENK